MCPKCGFSNQPGYAFCSNCGSPLAAGPAAAGAPPGYAPPYAVPPMPAYTYGASPWAYERTKQIDRTKTGILLLLIGALLSWIPYGIVIIGYLLLFIGAILVVLGRKAFGPTHARNAVISIVLFCVGVVVAFVVAVIAALTSLAGLIGPGGGPTASALQAAISALLVGGIAWAVMIWLAHLLFTYALQIQTGRILLWAAYGASIALSVAIFIIINPLLGSLVTEADYNRIAAQMTTISLLSVIPTALFVAADYLAWSRINRGEIPEPVPGAPLAPGVPPAWNPPNPPPSPPASPPPSGPAPPMNP